MPNTPDLTDLFDKPNPRTRVHSIASKAGITPDLADDYYKLTNIESGHNVNVRDSSKGAQGFGQVMPDVKGGTTRTVGGRRYNLRNPDENIEAGLRYFAEGGSDPVARRLHYFGGPRARQRYERTGQIPNISDGNMTAAQYVKATGAYQKSQSATPDLSDLFDKPSGQTQPATSKQNRVNNPPPTPATTPVESRQPSVPKQPLKYSGSGRAFDFQRPTPSLEVGAKVGGPQASQGGADLRRQDERDLARMNRIRGQVASEQTDAERQMGRAPNTAQARLFDPKLNVDEEVLKRISQEQDTEKAQADAQAEQQRLIGQFTDADRAEIADFTNHLQGKGGVYSGIRAGIRRGGSSALYKLAGLAEIGNQVAKRTVGESWIPDYLRKKALAGELSVNDIPEDKRNQLAEFLAQSGVGLAELAAAPGSITTKFAGMAGSEALGRNLPAKEVARETAKGAAMGAVQKYGEGLAPANAGRFKRAAVSAPAVGIGSGAVELATGATPREAALSAVTNAAFQGGGEMLRRTPQRRLSEAEAAPKQEVNVPERPETIQAQLAAVQQGTRPAVLVTRGEKQPNTPRGMSAVRTSEGTFYYDPKQVSRETLLAKVKDGTYGEVLGHVEPKSEATTEAVVARAADGTEVQASAVSPENVAKQAEVLQAQHPEATIETGGNELAQKVIQDRVAPTEVRGFDDVPLTERERAELDTYFDVEARIPESERVPPKPAKIDILGETEAKPTAAAPIEPVVTKPKTPLTETPVTPETPRAATEPREPSTTAVKNASMEADRAAMDLPELAQAEPRKAAEVHQRAIDANTKDPRSVDRLTEQALATDKPFTDVETAQVRLRAQEIKNRESEILREINETNDPQEIASKRAELDALTSEFDRLSQATKKAGTEWGRAGVARQQAIDQDFSLVAMKARVKAAKGEQLSPKENEKIEDLHKRLTVAEAERDAATKRADEAEANKQIERIATKASRQRGRKETRRALDDEFADLRTQFAQARASTKGVQASGLAGIDPEGQLTKILVKMMHNRAKVGTVEAQALVSEIYNAVKEHAEDLTERDIRDVLSGYSIGPKSTRTELQKRLDAIRSELQQLSKTEDIEAGVRSPRREGPTKGEARSSGIPREGPKLSDVRKVPAQGPRLSEGVGRKQGPRLEDAPKQGPQEREGWRRTEGPRLSEGTGRKEGPRITEAPKQGPRLSDVRRVPEQGPQMVEHGPSKEQFTRDVTRRTALEKEAVDIQKRIDEGRFEKTEREKPVYTRDTFAAQRRVNELKAEFEKLRYRATRSTAGKIIDTAVGVGNIPKTMLSMGDLSAVLRQGGIGYVQHPILSTRAAKDMLKSFTQHGFANVENAIKNAKDKDGRSLYELATKSGLEFTGVDRDAPQLNRREEGYLGSGALDTLSKGKFNPLKYTVKPIKDFSERTFVSFLDSQRMRIFEQQAQALRDMGLTGKEFDAAIKSQAKYINKITGRGSLGTEGNKLAPALNLAMFSPRLVASRFQYLANPLTYATKPKGARKLQMIDDAKFLVGAASVLGLAKAAGAQVNLDPDDADFLKMKVGNTRFDTLAGLQQPMRFMIRMAKAIKGGETYSGDPKGKILADFARSKASPEVGLGWDYFEGSNRLSGKKFDAKTDTAKALIPLPIQDFREAIKEDGALKGSVEALPSIFGVGTQTYKGAAEKPTTHAEKLARRFIMRKLPDEARDQEQIDTDTKKAELRARSRKGEDVSADQALGARLTERQVKGILDARNKTRLQEDVNRLGPREAIIVYSVATPSQRAEIKDLLQSKSALIDTMAPDLQEDVRKRYEAAGFTKGELPRKPREQREERRPRPTTKTGYLSPP